MARPSQEDVDTFISITGASEAIAVQKLSEHDGNLNVAVNAYFNEGDRASTRLNSHGNASDDVLNGDDPMDVEEVEATFPHYTTTRRWDAILPSGANFGRSPFDGILFPESVNAAPRVSHPREIREIPIDFKDGNTESGRSMPIIEDITGDAAEHGPEVHGTVVIDDGEDDDLLVHPASADERRNDDIHTMGRETTVVGVNNSSDLNNEIEEQMIRAAIEASKRDSEGKIHVVDDERVQYEHVIPVQGKGSSSSPGVDVESLGNTTAANGRQESKQTTSEIPDRVDSDEDEEAEDFDPQPLMRRRSPRFRSATEEPTGEVDLGSYSEPQGSRRQLNGNSFPSDEWGGISSVEHDEAVMLEAAMFGGIPERPVYDFSYSSQNTFDRHANPYPRAPRPPSPTLAAQRLLREQQDDEYLAALQADREKELKAVQEAEQRRLEEAAALESAREEEKLREEEAQRKLKEKEELDRQLSAKQASLPPEPAADDESAVTLLVRMPDGNRSGRRFLKSDKLQFLFDYIDILGVVMPSGYRLVRPFPRRAFGEAEKDKSLSELGLTSKQEALFLELV